jgi:hypothetical protein
MELIHKWYGGYGWGGDTRVFNPYSVVHFFNGNSFGDYWMREGRPGHLAALIKQRPIDYLIPTLEPYLRLDVKQADFDHIQAVPDLFHCGYLTIDQETTSNDMDPVSKELLKRGCYLFRFPNFEVSSHYVKNFISTALGYDAVTKLTDIGDALKSAIIERNADDVSRILGEILSHLINPQSQAGEALFCDIVRSIFSALGFVIHDGAIETAGNGCLYLEFPNRAIVIIGLRFLANNSLTLEDKFKILASEAKRTLSPALIVKRLSAAVRAEIEADIDKFALLPSGSVFHNRTEEEIDKVLAAAATKFFTTPERDRIVSSLLMENLNMAQVDKILKSSINEAVPEEFDGILQAAAIEALSDVLPRDCPPKLKHLADVLIHMGVAFSAKGSVLRAEFASPDPVE